MEWKIKDYKSVSCFMKAENGMTDENGFLNPPVCSVRGMNKAAQIIKDAAEKKIPVSVIGDYDVDGVSSTIILTSILMDMGIKPHIYIPKRFSEGYGITNTLISRILPNRTMSGELIITVDNGVTAIEQIKTLNQAGYRVLVIDHHEPLIKEGKMVLPDAELVVDPKVTGGDFTSYCAAGLAYKLHCELGAGDTDIAKAYAAIATIADVMPLKGDNRNIYKAGIEVINSNDCPIALQHLKSLANISYVDEETIGFSIGPLINAIGRLADNGASLAFAALYNDKVEGLQKMFEFNTERKKLVQKELDRLDFGAIRHPYVMDDCCNLGIAGNVAGKITEAMKVPTVVLVRQTDGTYKGSARGVAGVSLIDMLRKLDKYLISYGGHDGAAGLRVSGENLEVFKKAFAEMSIPEPDNSVEVDFDITEDEIPYIMADIAKYAPYGEGNKRPVVMLKGQITNVKDMSEGRYAGMMLGRTKSVMFNGIMDDGKTVCQRYKEAGNPVECEAVGYLNEDHWMDRVTVKFQIQDFRTVKKTCSDTRNWFLKQCGNQQG